MRWWSEEEGSREYIYAQQCSNGVHAGGVVGLVKTTSSVEKRYFGPFVQEEGSVVLRICQGVHACEFSPFHGGFFQALSSFVGPRLPSSDFFPFWQKRTVPPACVSPPSRADPAASGAPAFKRWTDARWTRGAASRQSIGFRALVHLHRGPQGRGISPGMMRPGGTAPSAATDPWDERVAVQALLRSEEKDVSTGSDAARGRLDVRCLSADVRWRGEASRARSCQICEERRAADRVVERG